MSALHSACLAGLAALAVACGGGPIVAPLRYGPPAPAPEEAFRATPPDASPVTPSIPLAFQVQKLANGLEVAVLERHGLPIVSVQLVAARGMADTPALPDAYFILHRLLESGTADRTPRELSLAYARIGAPHRAFFGDDACGIGAHIGAADLDATVSLLAEAATRPRLDPRALDSARTSWLQDFEGSGGVPVNIVRRNATTLAFGHAHPYAGARPTRAHTDGLRADDLAALHARLFHPAHVTLVVVGDVTFEAVMASATRWLGGWSPPTSSIPRSDLPPYPPLGPRLVFVERRQSRQIDAAVVARGPDAASPDLLALEVLARVFGSASSRLRGEVRVESGAAYNFGAGVLSLRQGSMLAIGAALDKDKAVPALRAMVAAIAEARTQGVPEADFERARTTVISQWRGRVASSEGLASLAASTLGSGQPLASLATYPERLAALTREDLRRAAQRWLGPESLHVVVTGDGTVEGALSELGLGEAERRDAWAEPVRGRAPR